MIDRKKSDAPAQIVDDDILAEPRLKGHRISVVDIAELLDSGESIEQIADNVYPHLRKEQVEIAADYIDNHPVDISEHLRKRRQIVATRRAEAKRRKLRAVSEPCPICGGDLKGDDNPPALVCCSECSGTLPLDRVLD